MSFMSQMSKSDKRRMIKRKRIRQRRQAQYDRAFAFGLMLSKNFPDFPNLYPYPSLMGKAFERGIGRL